VTDKQRDADLALIEETEATMRRMTQGPYFTNRNDQLSGEIHYDVAGGDSQDVFCTSSSPRSKHDADGLVAALNSLPRLLALAREALTAREDALEEAARLCEARVVSSINPHLTNSFKCAAEIRAIARAPRKVAAPAPPDTAGSGEVEKWPLHNVRERLLGVLQRGDHRCHPSCDDIICVSLRALDAANRRASYWKDEHTAANAALDAREADLKAANAKMEECERNLYLKLDAAEAERDALRAACTHAAPDHPYLRIDDTVCAHEGCGRPKGEHREETAVSRRS
jgi:hypothetical protein